ncbi:helix-turn-helix transcriptional regulator [Gracilibacillus salinarum]|uniref:AraC family transcriptional regulator n=1 Tax=Gracilibacillus salinarum TaxID=2932255 RepID=A0ABY4GL46_9BACI|nr:AraC family transcriptional regulator [Gracilibacillus salinarum]UOQ84900.1 AraC family transcriptional regulator [Gracilibacillus salinarum]
MDMLWKINIERPVAYFKSGQFVSNHGWKHKEMKLTKDFEIIIGVHKSIFIQIEDKQFELQHGDVLLIPPGLQYFGYHPSENEASFFWLHFFPRSETDRYPTDKFINHLIGSLIDHHRESINNASFLPDFFSLKYTNKPFILMNQILDIANNSYYSTYAVDYLVTEMLIELTEQFSKRFLQSYTDQYENTHKFNQILEWIRVNIYEDIHVKDVADTFSMNADHLTRVFKKNIGMSTIKYINTIKLNKAKELLCTTNKTIKEISYQLNFKEDKYFMKLFKNYEGMTPSQFRDAYTNTYINTLSVDPDIPVPDHLNFE